MAAIKAPPALAAAGRKLWREVTAQFDLRADELRVLHDAAREADIIAELEVARVGVNLISRGSQGQDVINPLISELRQHRQTLATLLRQLKLADGESSAEISSKARAAANARWARRGA